MTDRKFTDERIIRCLNECNGKENAVAHIVDQGEEELVTLAMILEIINRQKAEIEMLQKARENCLEIIELGEKHILEVGERSIKEFAERIKAEMRDLSSWKNGDATLYLVGESFIDKIAKEMTEEKTDGNP